jgi:hypothetical protein
VVPWQALIDLIELSYPKSSKMGGRPQYPLATMLRIHLLRQWYSLSLPAMDEALIEAPTMRRFAGIDLINDRIPDETTILNFRHLLEKHELGAAMKVASTIVLWLAVVCHRPWEDGSVRCKGSSSLRSWRSSANRKPAKVIPSTTSQAKKSRPQASRSSQQQRQ